MDSGRRAGGPTLVHRVVQHIVQGVQHLVQHVVQGVQQPSFRLRQRKGTQGHPGAWGGSGLRRGLRTQPASAHIYDTPPGRVAAVCAEVCVPSARRYLPPVNLGGCAGYSGSSSVSPRSGLAR